MGMQYENAVQVLTDALQIGMRSPLWRTANEVGVMAPAKPDANDWRVVSNCEAGQVIALVEAQSPLLRAWAWVCYGGTRSRGALEVIEQHVYDSALKGGLPVQSYKSCLRHLLLIELAVDGAMAKARTGRAQNPHGAVPTLVGIPRTSWHRHYKGVYAAMVAALLSKDDRLKELIETFIWEQKGKQSA